MIHNIRKQYVCALFAGAVLSTFSGFTAAQSLESTASVGVSNLDYNGANVLISLFYDSKDGGLAQVSLPPMPFTGLDGAGFEETLTYSGGAKASVVAPGQRPGMRVQAHGSLMNTFYNPSNPPYSDATVSPPIIDEEGVPDNFYAYGKAGIVELLSYGGFGAGQYYARYFYRIHGRFSGDLSYRAYLRYQVGNHPPEFASFGTILPNGEVLAEYATQRYLITAGMPHEQKALLHVEYRADTQSVPEGSDIVGMYDFSQTVTLEYIEVVDEDNNLVSGWTVSAASGLDYDLPIFRSDFDPVTTDGEMIAANAEEICAHLQDIQPEGQLQQDGPTVLRRGSPCAGPIGAIREIKFRQVGASETSVED